MAEETQKPDPTSVAQVSVPVEQVVVPETEKSTTDKTDPPPSEPAAAEPEEKKMTKVDTFKEETNVVSELPESQKKALEELKILIQEALNKHEFTDPPPKEQVKEEEKPAEEKPAEEVPPPDTAAEEPPKAEEEPKAEEPPKPEEEPKAEEPPKPEPKAEEPPKTEEPAKLEEETKAEEQPKTEEPPKTQEVEVKMEEEKSTTSATVEEEKTVEAIKETIVEVPVEETAATAAPELPVEPEEVSIWGIPLLADERSDVILLKFLRARDFKVKDAFTMIRNTVKWRKEFGVDALLDEDLGGDYERVVFMHGYDKEGRPVCYNVFGEFQKEELYKNTFADAEKRNKFIKWLVQFLEKTIRNFDFSPKGINSFVLVNDLKNSPGFGKRDVYKAIDKFLEILQDNYPEFVAKQLCINVSWWYLAYNWVYLTVFTPRSKSKFVFASPSKTAETLFKYIAPEQVPVQFGGHSKDGEGEFSPCDVITEVTIKPGGKHLIDLPFSEVTEMAWELRVIGWEVSYGAEFIPEKEGAYSLNIAKPRKLTPTDEAVIYDSFKVTEPGKVVLTIDNHSSKKKKLLYRSKVKASQ